MSLKLQDLLKTAKSKGYLAKDDQTSKESVVKPWQSGNLNPLNNADTIPTQKVNNTDTIPTQKVNNADTIPTQKVNNADTMPTQKVNNADTIPTQKVNNADTIPTQKLNNADTMPTQKVNNADTIPTQKLNNADTIPTQKVNNADTIPTQKVNNADTIPTQKVNNADTIPTQKVNNADTMSTQGISYFKLVGGQKEIVEWIYENIKTNKQKYTSRLAFQDIVSNVNITSNSVKTTVHRLLKKLVLLKVDEKRGRNGWMIFSLNDSVYKELELLDKGTQSSNQKDKKSLYNSNTTNTINKYSSDTEEQKPTNTQNDQLIELIKQQNDKIAELQKQFLQQAAQVQPEIKNVTVIEPTENNTLESDNDDWANLDFSSLTEFGFTKRHVTQIKNFNKNLDADNQLTVDSVQESIEHYAWALQNRLEEMASYAPANNRLRGLIGVLKKGGNWTEANYKSPEDLAFEASLKAKEERLLKLKEQKERVFNIEFELWRESLTATELTDIEENGELQGKMPPSAFKNKGDNKHYVAALKTYFKNNVYKG
ncbi:hypothetical protein [Cysteiniphilum litorale]|uniref:Uncharacterized protein n=2 Tax=Cysteiniphilum TaxID=2056696 RepID=A0A8J3E8B2_9GAMM|nr:hypothetical protein [Cysteiniphilum litorale]GGF93820.1 hypothetical protein GCM10010995_08820 [Cysteiniphilum litorale]